MRHDATVLSASGAESNPSGRSLFRFLPALRIDERILARAGLLFLALCLIKFILLGSFRKHLFEMHWRTSNEQYNWVNLVAFYVFGILVGLALWRMKVLCLAAGTRAIRLANMSVLAIGAFFILFTFHEGDKNYLDPILSGVLKWTDLGSYFSLNFFFRPPFLAAWIFGYGAVYYCLVRTRREHLILEVTAVVAAVYVMLYLRDLTTYRRALIVTDCVGIACLLASLKAQRRLGWFWLAAPLVWTGFWFALFQHLDTRANPAGFVPAFAILFWGALVLFGGITLLAWRGGFLVGWSWILPFAMVAFLLLTSINYTLATTYNQLLGVAFTVPRYILGELILVAAVLMMAVVYQRFRPGGSLWWMDVLNLALITVALFDLRLSQIMGTRLDWSVLSLAFGETPKMMWRMARPYLPAVAGALLGIAAVYALLLRAARWCFRSGRFSGALESGNGFLFLLLLTVSLGLAGRNLIGNDKGIAQSALLLAGTSPLWQRATSEVMDEKTFKDMAKQLGMSRMLAPRESSGVGPKREMNVVLIFQESTYNKYLSLFSGTEETQPLLSKYKDRMELFPNFFSNFAGSINARFATFTGLYPVRDFKAFTLERVHVASIFEVLREQGYASSLFYSSSFDYTGFREFLRDRGIDELYDADTMPGERKTTRVSWGLREEETLGAMQERIKKYAAEKQKFFLTYIPAAPHYPFDGTPARFVKFQRQEMGDFTPLYLNELLYMDWIISSLIDQLKESGLLENTLVVITADHGEMLGSGDDRLLGHGWAVTPELANVPLILMNPAESGYRVNHRVGSQVDLLPTILDRLAVPVPGNQLYQGDSLYAASSDTNGAIFLNSFRQYGIVGDHEIVCGDREYDTTRSPKVFSITNDLARTYFSETDAPNFKVPSIVQFDDFQANFLRNYSHYCDLLRLSRLSSSGPK